MPKALILVVCSLGRSLIRVGYHSCSLRRARLTTPSYTSSDSRWSVPRRFGLSLSPCLVRRPIT